MLIIGCDYHLDFQPIAWVDAETRECGERKLRHSDGEAESFYRDLKLKGVRVRVGMEAAFPCRQGLVIDACRQAGRSDV